MSLSAGLTEGAVYPDFAVDEDVPTSLRDEGLSASPGDEEEAGFGGNEDLPVAFMRHHLEAGGAGAGLRCRATDMTGMAHCPERGSRDGGVGMAHCAGTKENDGSPPRTRAIDGDLRVPAVIEQPFGYD
ncbi:hypothetical protein [Nonomuraea sp. CA-141351]|uniref:hypothetical protein n=1 Tax=Nonomuraea sp. CA-141351 TaxID=3239996 RepID=UPI003D901D66